VNRLARLDLVHRQAGALHLDGAAGAVARIVVGGVPQVVQAPAGGEAGGDEEGARPVRVEGEVVGSRIELVVLVILACGQDHGELYPVHELGAIGAHDGVPLQVRADQEITEAGAVGLECQAVVRGEVDAGKRQHEIDTPFTAPQQLGIGLVEHLGNGGKGIYVVFLEP